MSRSVLLFPVISLAVIFAWLIYDERQRSEALIAQHELLTTSLTPSSSLETAARDTAEPRMASIVMSGNNVISGNNFMLGNNALEVTPVAKVIAQTHADTHTRAASNSTPSVDTTNTQPPANSETPAPPIETTACSSFDEASLLAAFDVALANFLANASALYGDRYENLQYQLSSKTATLAENQGTVSVSYAGTVKELSTGQDVNANGSISANFSWNGCAWQLLDYSFT
jgi:hypothetical protein